MKHSLSPAACPVSTTQVKTASPFNAAAVCEYCPDGVGPCGSRTLVRRVRVWWAQPAMEADLWMCASCEAMHTDHGGIVARILSRRYNPTPADVEAARVRAAASDDQGEGPWPAP